MGNVKNASFRYDTNNDEDIAKWLNAQPNKNESLRQAIRTVINNFGYNDLRKELPKKIEIYNQSSNNHPEKVKHIDTTDKHNENNLRMLSDL